MAHRIIHTIWVIIEVKILCMHSYCKRKRLAGTFKWELIHFGVYIRPIIASCTNLHANKQTNIQMSEEEIAAAAAAAIAAKKVLGSFYFLCFLLLLLLSYDIYVCLFSPSITIFSEFCAFDLCAELCAMCASKH